MSKRRFRRVERSGATAALLASLTILVGAVPNADAVETLSARNRKTATTTPATRVASSAPGVAKPALWRVRDNDTTIYLFGTVHVLREGMNWFSGPVRAAYDGSTEVVIEVIEPDVFTAQAAVTKAATDPNGPALSAKLDAKARKQYEAAMARLGMPVAMFEQYEPWFVDTTLQLLPVLAAGYDPEAGVEAVLVEQVRADGKKLGELETFNQQLGFLDGLSEKTQLASLKATLEGLEDDGRAREELDELVAAWAKGDVDRLGVLLNEGFSGSPEIKKVLLVDRNRRWAEWIDKRLDRPGTVFLAVGAGHLAGKESVQAMLRARGLTASRLS